MNRAGEKAVNVGNARATFGGEKAVSSMASRLLRAAAGAALAAALVPGAQAQEGSDASLEVTIRLLPENAVGPGEITRRIELPPAAPDTEPPGERTEGARPGIERGRGEGEEGPQGGRERDPGEVRDQRPDEARELGRGAGREAANEARERGREAGREAADQARENRENAGRRDDARRPDDRGRPDAPGRPDDAGPPGRPDDAGPPGRPDDAGPPDAPPGRP